MGVFRLFAVADQTRCIPRHIFIAIAIKTVLGGKPFYSNEVALQWMEGSLFPRAVEPFERLTAREREVFKQILAGLKDREIADRMFLSKRTVDKHRQNLMAKLGVRNAIELVHLAAKWGSGKIL